MTLVLVIHCLYVIIGSSSILSRRSIFKKCQRSFSGACFSLWGSWMIMLQDCLSENFLTQLTFCGKISPSILTKQSTKTPASQNVHCSILFFSGRYLSNSSGFICLSTSSNIFLAISPSRWVRFPDLMFLHVGILTAQFGFSHTLGSQPSFTPIMMSLTSKYPTSRNNAENPTKAFLKKWRAEVSGKVAIWLRVTGTYYVKTFSSRKVVPQYCLLMFSTKQTETRLASCCLRLQQMSNYSCKLLLVLTKIVNSWQLWPVDLFFQILRQVESSSLSSWGRLTLLGSVTEQLQMPWELPIKQYVLIIGHQSGHIQTVLLVLVSNNPFLAPTARSTGQDYTYGAERTRGLILGSSEYPENKPTEGNQARVRVKSAAFKL